MLIVGVAHQKEMPVPDGSVGFGPAHATQLDLRLLRERVRGGHIPARLTLPYRIEHLCGGIEPNEPERIRRIAVLRGADLGSEPVRAGRHREPRERKQIGTVLARTQKQAVVIMPRHRQLRCVA